MFDKVTLGIRGDLNLLKKRIKEDRDITQKTSFILSESKNGVHTIEFEVNGELNIFDRFLNLLAEYIIERYELQLIERILSISCTYLTPLQKREVLRNSTCFSDDFKTGFNSRKQAIIASLYDYFRENSSMLLDGFVTFRLKEYEQLLEDMANQLAEECISRHEYEDFIDLLKYFVNIQEKRPQLTHVTVTPQAHYELFSDRRENITKRCMSDFVDTDDIPENANYDDLLISMLITLAPKKITVHNSEYIANKELFKTISLVFDEQVSYCKGCELCRKKQFQQKNCNL